MGCAQEFQKVLRLKLGALVGGGREASCGVETSLTQSETF